MGAWAAEPSGRFRGPEDASTVGEQDLRQEDPAMSKGEAMSIKSINFNTEINVAATRSN